MEESIVGVMSPGLSHTQTTAGGELGGDEAGETSGNATEGFDAACHSSHHVTPFTCLVLAYRPWQCDVTWLPTMRYSGFIRANARDDFWAE